MADKTEELKIIDNTTYCLIKNLRESMTPEQKLVIMRGIPMIVEKSTLDKILDFLKGVIR